MLRAVSGAQAALMALLAAAVLPSLSSSLGASEQLNNDANRPQGLGPTDPW